MRYAPIRIILYILFAGVVAVALVLGVGSHRFNAPRVLGLQSSDTIVDLPSGASLTAVAEILHKADVLDDTRLFNWGVRLSGAARDLKAGEYQIPAGASMSAVMEILKSGRTVLHAVTIPEGLTVAEVVALLKSTEALSGDVSEPPAEGTLLPETYSFARGARRADLLNRMGKDGAILVAELWAGRQAELPFKTPAQALVLASIIEKETALPSERATIAGVFVNRLRRGMRLQSDPTVVYALTQGKGPLGRALIFADLETESPFNTYKVRGLPPAPIANPGRAAIAAALQPAETAALYFVADGTGGHMFAKSLAEHQINVRRWRKLKRRRRNGS
jgi:UPF0755 protein